MLRGILRHKVLDRMENVDERQRARQIVLRRNLGALANDTKWQEFFAEIIAKQIPLEIMLIGGPEVFECHRVWSPSRNYIEGSGMGPCLFVYLERVTSLRADEVAGIASSVGLECAVDNGRATVYGYR